MFEDENPDSKINLDDLTSKLKVQNRNIWWQESLIKDKLCTFREICDRNEIQSTVKTNLDRGARSLAIKLKVGVLPLKIETGRWKKKKDEPKNDKCEICTSNAIENEYHFLLHCDALSEVRNEMFAKLGNIEGFHDMSDAEKMKVMYDSDKLKVTATYIEKLMEKRKSLMYTTAS